MRTRTHSGMKGEISTTVLLSKTINPPGALAEHMAQPQPAFFSASAPNSPQGSRDMHAHCGLHTVVALRGESALAGWLKGPEGKGKVKERTLHAC